jgi:hypothetical protein
VIILLWQRRSRRATGLVAATALKSAVPGVRRSPIALVGERRLRNGPSTRENVAILTTSVEVMKLEPRYDRPFPLSMRLEDRYLARRWAAC